MKRKFIENWPLKIENFLNIVFPIECLGCSAPGAFLCDICKYDCLGQIPEMVCPVCSFPSPAGITHAKCLSPQKINGIFAAGDYAHPLLNQSIGLLKYKNVKILSRPLAEFVFQKFSENFEALILKNEFALTYVPMHSKKIKQRGYNQSKLLAEQLSIISNLRLEKTLVKIKNTDAQAKLKRHERLVNLQKAFAVAQTANIKFKNYILIDDVYTTGSTMLECAKILKRNGANQVWGLAVAREVNKKTA